VATSGDAAVGCQAAEAGGKNRRAGFPSATPRLYLVGPLNDVMCGLPKCRVK